MKRFFILAGLITAVVIAAVRYYHWKSRRQVETRNANICLSNLRIIDGAKQTYAREHRLKPGDSVPAEALSHFHVWPLKCPSGGTYTINPVGEDPTCSVPGHKLQMPFGRPPQNVGVIEGLSATSSLPTHPATSQPEYRGGAR